MISKRDIIERPLPESADQDFWNEKWMVTPAAFLAWRTIWSSLEDLMIIICYSGRCPMEIEVLTAQLSIYIIDHFVFFRDMAISDAAETNLPSFRVLTTESSSSNCLRWISISLFSVTCSCSASKTKFLLDLWCYEMQNKFSFQNNIFDLILLLFCI